MEIGTPAAARISAATILKYGLFFEPPLDNLKATAIFNSFHKQTVHKYFDSESERNLDA